MAKHAKHSSTICKTTAEGSFKPAFRCLTELGCVEGVPARVGHFLAKRARTCSCKTKPGQTLPIGMSSPERLELHRACVVSRKARATRFAHCSAHRCCRSNLQGVDGNHLAQTELGGPTGATRKGQTPECC
eukprot:9317213-Alexandrium_andersonii.AAC.1